MKHQQDKQKNESAINNEIELAQELLNASLETFGETRKRLSSDDDSISPNQRKKPKTASETISYLREKNENELDLRKQELELRKSEMVERQTTQTQMQQQQTAQLAQQQQQVNIALLQLMDKFKP